MKLVMFLRINYHEAWIHWMVDRINVMMKLLVKAKHLHCSTFWYWKQVLLVFNRPDTTFRLVGCRPLYCRQDFNFCAFIQLFLLLTSHSTFWPKDLAVFCCSLLQNVASKTHWSICILHLRSLISSSNIFYATY